MAAEALPYAAMFTGYILAGLSHAAYLRHKGWKRTAVWMARAALLIQTLVLLERWSRAREPFATLFDTTLFLTWLALLAYILAEMLWPVGAVGAVMLPILLLLMLISLGLPGGEGPRVPVVGGAQLLWHVVTAVASYALFALAFFLSVAYLLLERQLRQKEFRLFFHRLPALEALDALAYRVVLVAFPLLTLAAASGLKWAREAWRGDFYRDPKLGWTAATWSIYAAYLLLRGALGWRGHRGALLNVCGFLAVMFNYLVINPFFSRWHGL